MEGCTTAHLIEDEDIWSIGKTAAVVVGDTLDLS